MGCKPAGYATIAHRGRVPPEALRPSSAPQKAIAGRSEDLYLFKEEGNCIAIKLFEGSVVYSDAVDAMEYKQRSCREFFSYRMLCKLMVLTQAILLVSGCAALEGFPERPTDPSSDLRQLKPHIDADQIAACLNATTLECRNKIIAARLYATDLQFSRFEEGLFQETRSAGFAATLASLGLTSAAAGAGGVASQVLSGAAAFIIGGREAYQKEVLAERTLVAIHTSMRAGRARVGLRLRTGLQQSVDEYPLAWGLADLNDYYNAGTVLGALVGITESVGAEAQRAERRLEQQFAYSPDPSRDRLQTVLCADPECENLDAARLAEMRACWPTIGVPGTTLVFDFLFQAAFAEERRAVAECMGLR